ncbi:MAG: 6-carboxytetrahydropterin synthase [Pseudomonadota bacterium]
MFTVSKTFSFCYGHRLLKDEGKCRHLHGHTGRATFVLGSDALDDKGMVFHFDRLKETVGRWLEENLDHVLLLHKDDPVADLLKTKDERFLAMDSNPTAESIAKMLFDTAVKFELPIISVEVWESDTSKATYTKQKGR